MNINKLLVFLNQLEDFLSTMMDISQMWGTSYIKKLDLRHRLQSVFIFGDGHCPLLGPVGFLVAVLYQVAQHLDCRNCQPVPLSHELWQWD